MPGVGFGRFHGKKKCLVLAKFETRHVKDADDDGGVHASLGGWRGCRLSAGIILVLALQGRQRRLGT